MNNPNWEKKSLVVAKLIRGDQPYSLSVTTSLQPPRSPFASVVCTSDLPPVTQILKSNGMPLKDNLLLSWSIQAAKEDGRRKENSQKKKACMPPGFSHFRLVFGVFSPDATTRRLIKSEDGYISIPVPGVGSWAAEQNRPSCCAVERGRVRLQCKVKKRTWPR